jgi:transcriptional regulator with XRE-family HTH domain
MNIGKRLKEIREKRNLSQYQLSALAKIPRNTIIRIERGKVDPRISTLCRICQALGVDIKEVFR